MGRRATQATLTERWVKANAEWLESDHPLVGQLRMLARTMDADMAEKGRIAPSAASAYQKALDRLDAQRPGAHAGRADDPAGGDDPAGLFGPGPSLVR